jgi:hypothetical protein
VEKNHRLRKLLIRLKETKMRLIKILKILKIETEIQATLAEKKYLAVLSLCLSNSKTRNFFSSFSEKGPGPRANNNHNLKGGYSS